LIDKISNDYFINPTVWFNFDTNKFDNFNFETEEEILLFFDDKLSKFKK